MFARFLLSPLSGYLAIAMASLVAVLSIALWLTDRRLDNARMELAAARTAIASIKSAYDSAVDGLNDCRQVNIENAEARDAALERAEQAEERLRILDAESDAEILEIENDADEIREASDQECRTLRDPLPPVFWDWIWLQHDTDSSDGI